MKTFLYSTREKAEKAAAKFYKQFGGREREAMCDDPYSVEDVDFIAPAWSGELDAIMVDGAEEEARFTWWYIDEAEMHDAVLEAVKGYATNETDSYDASNKAGIGCCQHDKVVALLEDYAEWFRALECPADGMTAEQLAEDERRAEACTDAIFNIRKEIL